MVKFLALKDFFSEEMESQYCKDLIYTLRPDTDFVGADEETLFLLHKNMGLGFCVRKWVRDGKVEIVAGDTIISGIGE